MRAPQRLLPVVLGLLLATPALAQPGPTSPDPGAAPAPAGEIVHKVGSVTGYVVADPDAPPVTAGNLLENERFWPYKISLTETWQPPEEGHRPLQPGRPAVLLRVREDGRTAVIDFGRYGRWDVPVARTDLVDRANDLRTGQASKLAPNLVHAIGPRMMPSDIPRPYDLRTMTREVRGFLSVYAAPEDFDEIAPALAPLHERHGVWTVLFPQGPLVDGFVREKIQGLDWRVPFLADAYSEPYTLSQLADEAPLPAVMLQTAEGRVLYVSAWGPDVAIEVEAALDEAFGKPAASAAVQP